jgi:hypothetical protein
MIAIILLVCVCAVGLSGVAAVVVAARRQWRANRRVREQRAAHAERLAEMARLAAEREMIGREQLSLVPSLPMIERPAPPRRAARGTEKGALYVAEADAEVRPPALFLPGLARARASK